MRLTRRDALALSAGALACSPTRAFASADEEMAAFTGGVETGTEGIVLEVPHLAENGNAVPVSVDAPNAESILVLALGNPNPGVATFHFGPRAGSSAVSTRIRLAESQEVVAVAKLADGRFVRAAKTVNVTIGGCGG